MGQLSPTAFEVPDNMPPTSNRLRQPTNPWLLDEVCQLIEAKIENCGEPDEFNEWEPERYARVAAEGLLREGLISLRPGPLPTPKDVEVEQAIRWLAGIISRAGREPVADSVWPRDASEAQRVVNILNALREPQP